MSALDLLLGSLLLVTGLLAVRLKNAIHAALALAANFVLLGGVYITQEARFLGWVQVIVYAGAIMVLFVFVIMLLDASEPEPGEDPHPWLPGAALAVGILVFAALGAALAVAKEPRSAGAGLEGGTAAALGPVLWGDWLYPVLLVAALLFAATVAAVALVRPGRGDGS